MEISYPIVGWSLTRLAREQIGLARKNPADWAPSIARLPPLKHADDQSVASLVALRRACDDFSLGAIDFSDWGLIAAPRFLGREMIGRTLRRYPVDGAWGVSMQLIPQHMLHSPASMLSIALGLQGSAIGAGGGVESEREAWLAAISLLRQDIAGLWLVCSGWEPELVVRSTSEEVSESRCLAVALAIQNSPVRQPTSWLRVRQTSEPDAHSPAPAGLLSQADRAVEAQVTRFSHCFVLGAGLRANIELLPPAPPALPAAPLETPNLICPFPAQTGS